MSSLRAGPLVALGLACASLLAPSCARGDTLALPSLHLRVENGLCGWQLGLDGGGRLWHEQGCENGNPAMRRAGSADSAQLARVDRALAGLPPQGGELTPEQFQPVELALNAAYALQPSSCFSDQVVLVHRDEDGNARQWTLPRCEVPQ